MSGGAGGAAVHEVRDAGAGVRDGARPPGTEGAFVDGLRDDCGLLIGGVLEVVRRVTGRDLLAELLEPLAGDMDAVSSMRAGWTELAAATGAVGENYRALAGQVPAVWEGLSADAAAGLAGRMATAHDEQREAAALVSDQLGHVVSVSKATAEVVCAALEFIDGLVQELLLDAAAGPLGWTKAAATSPRMVVRMIRLIDQGRDAITDLVRAVELAVAVLRRVEALLDALAALAAVVETGAHAEAGQDMGAVAEAGFLREGASGGRAA